MNELLGERLFSDRRISDVPGVGRDQSGPYAARTHLVHKPPIQAHLDHTLIICHDNWRIWIVVYRRSRMVRQDSQQL